MIRDFRNILEHCESNTLYFTELIESLEGYGMKSINLI